MANSRTMLGAPGYILEYYRFDRHQQSQTGWQWSIVIILSGIIVLTCGNANAVAFVLTPYKVTTI